LDWATFGVDLHLELSRAGARRAGLEAALRDAIRDGRLSPGTRLPSTRSLASSLGVARGTVSAAYDQLVAEGYLSARTGSGTVVAAVVGAANPQRSAVAAPPPRYDLRPGSPDVSTFPTAEWLRAMRRALSAAPISAYDYGDPRGSLALRTALAAYLGRARGVLAGPDQIVITSGYVQALSLLASVLGGPVAMEDPGLTFHRDVVRRTGAAVVPLPVDHHGARFDDLGEARVAVVTPAHQYPTGVTLHPARRQAAAAWARRTGGLLVEDDYDGEFRYDRQPVGALQGMAPHQVAYVGTAAKTLGPALRLAWLVLPPDLVEPVAHAKRLADVHTETLGQLALADMIGSHAYDRHVRSVRLRYRRRRDALLARLGSRYPVSGIAAGMHVLLDLPSPTAEAEVLDRAAAAGLAVGDLTSHWHENSRPHETSGPHESIRRHERQPDRRAGLVIGYATPGEGAYLAAVDTLLRVLRAAVV
jgi:GntR family transcriptional regulator/MocR family aminotransferase